MKPVKNQTTKKQAGKKTKPGIRILLLSFAFCAGLAGMGWLVYVHRRVIAAMVNGTPMPESPHKHCRTE